MLKRNIDWVEEGGSYFDKLVISNESVYFNGHIWHRQNQDREICVTEFSKIGLPNVRPELKLYAPGAEQTVPISLVQVLSYQHNHNSNIKDCIDCVLCSTGLSWIGNVPTLSGFSF